MELNEYQKKAMTTCMESSNNFAYMILNLFGEVGEFSGKIAKLVRKGHAKIMQHNLFIHTPLPDNLSVMGKEEFERVITEYDNKDLQASEELKKEAGDILWQLSGLCSVMGWTLEDVAQQNLDKLASRKERNVIDGEGDNR